MATILEEALVDKGAVDWTDAAVAPLQIVVLF